MRHLDGAAWGWRQVTTEEKYMSPDNKVKANYYVDSIADFFKM
jgi:hypothetical protein